MDNTQALANLKDACSGLLAFGIQPFLCYGTALGAVREGKIIDHDKDTDLGILAEQFSFEIFSSLLSRGFSIGNIYGMRHVGMEISFTRNGVKTDLMLFYRKGNRRYNCLWNNGGQNGMRDAIVHSYDAGLFDQFDIAKLDNEIFFVPSPSTAYLEAVYGKDWQVPVTSFDWRTDHKCKDNSLQIP